MHRGPGLHLFLPNASHLSSSKIGSANSLLTTILGRAAAEDTYTYL